MAQCVGAIIGAAFIAMIAMGKEGFDLIGSGFAANGYGAHSLSITPCLPRLACEMLLTFFFVMVILGATDGRAPAGFAPLATGLALVLVHLISIPGDQHLRQPRAEPWPGVVCR